MADGVTEASESVGEAPGARHGNPPRDIIEPLEVAFDAAIARDEEHAADDLALSLDQDRTLEEVLERAESFSTLTTDRRAQSVDGLGADYVVGPGPQRSITRLDQVVFRIDGAPRSIDRENTTFLERLREVARAGRSIEVTTTLGPFGGRLERARRDHLQLRAAVGTLLIPYETIVSVKLTHGG